MYDNLTNWQIYGVLLIGKFVLRVPKRLTIVISGEPWLLCSPVGKTYGRELRYEKSLHFVICYTLGWKDLKLSHKFVTHLVFLHGFSFSKTSLKLTLSRFYSSTLYGIKKWIETQILNIFNLFLINACARSSILSLQRYVSN